ncbi:hypothetical protein N7466_009228 [Penicillium verhagenii]|uniref:uncharacterized protein n=1 Tax=Penicillium verhagenii TaxID=1562060 RepID=UPI00254533B6|nr:uncharacterized protein N7466_009228 [Penicillium verhagenii]KAJ5920902.1 hypothetical protein N7466_009228 [Penicillium verhagenii]
MYFRALTALLFVAYANAHSWVEEIRVIAENGTFTGAAGYARGNYLRTAAGFNDTTMTYLIPPDGQANVTVIYDSTKLCKDTQQDQTQTTGSPRLQANAGDAIALRYQENGHVTLPWNQPGKPPNRGTVYVYGTTDPKLGETLNDVHGVWGWNGTGSGGNGTLLSVQNFDDGRCYQINTGNISEYRQEKYPHVANTLMGADLWCQQDIQIPTTATTGSLYTLYWVWDWPTKASADDGYPDGKLEIYTTCIDIDIVGQAASDAEATDDYTEGQSLDSAAISSEFDDLTNEDAVTLSGTTAAALSTSMTSTSTIQAETSTSSAIFVSTMVTQATASSSAVSISTMTVEAATVIVTVGAVTAWRTVTEVEVRTVTVDSCQATEAAS